MKVLVIGGTGYIGSAVVGRIAAAGHTAVVLVRDRGTAPDGVEHRVGDLTDPAHLADALGSDVDVVVHAATPSGDPAVDRAAVEALLVAVSGRRLVYVSGVWVLGATPGPAIEASPVRPASLVAARPQLEDLVRRATAAEGVVVRPGIVHGGGGGIPALLVAWAAEAGIGRYVGDPSTRWPMVHRDDLADLVLLAVESAPTGSVLHGVAEPAVPVVDLARAADLAAGGTGRAQAWPVADAAAVLGAPFAEALALDQEVLAPATRALGWVPRRPGAVEDLRDGSYRLGSHRPVDLDAVGA